MAVPKDGWFAQRDRLRQRLDTDSRLAASARVIGGLLISMCSPDREYAYPPIDWLVRATGFSRATVNRAIRQLKAAGYFKVRSGFIDFVNGGGYASHYHPVFTTAKDFSLADVFGPSVTSDTSPVSSVSLPSVTGDTLMSEDDGEILANFSPSAPASAIAPASASDSGTMWDDFLRLYALAVEHNKQGDKPMEKTYTDYVEARGYPNVTADSIYAEYEKELAFYKGKRRNKADLLPRFLQNPPKFTGALNGAKPSATGKPSGKTRRADSGKPVGGQASTGNAKSRVLRSLGWGTAEIERIKDRANAGSFNPVSGDELDGWCRMLADLAITHTKTDLDDAMSLYEKARTRGIVNQYGKCSWEVMAGWIENVSVAAE